MKSLKETKREYIKRRAKFIIQSAKNLSYGDKNQLEWILQTTQNKDIDTLLEEIGKGRQVIADISESHYLGVYNEELDKILEQISTDAVVIGESGINYYSRYVRDHM